MTRQLQIPDDEIQSIGSEWKVARDNLKIVQLPNVTGGRTRLLTDSGLQANIKKALDLMLRFHKDKRFALITPLGANLGKHYKGKTAKDIAIRFLQSTAKKHKRKLVPVDKSNIQQGNLPDGTKEIPIVHYGVKGVNVLANYDVIVELVALFYNDTDIKDAVRVKFGEDVSSLESQRVNVKFYTNDGTIDVNRWVYANEHIQMEKENTQRADVHQTEGRFIRTDDFHKTIYRFHGVNIEPYPTRIYLSWETFFRYEFGSLIKPEELLSDKALEYWRGIKDNVRVNEEFSNRDLPSLVKYTKHHHDYLKRLAELGFIELVTPGGKGRGNAAVYRRLK